MKFEKKHKKYPWTARRIIALLGILLLAGLYLSTLVFALLDSPAAKGLLMAAIFCTIAVPVLLYAMILVAKRVRENEPSAEEDTEEDPS